MLKHPHPVSIIRWLAILGSVALVSRVAEAAHMFVPAPARANFVGSRVLPPNVVSKVGSWGGLRAGATPTAAAGALPSGLTTLLAPEVGTATPTPASGLSPAPSLSPDPEVEFTGVLTAINGNVWTVNGLSVLVTLATEIKDNPQIGDLVKVHATPLGDGSLAAREVDEIAMPVPGATGQPGGEVEFTGVLTAINGNVWTVNGLSVLVTLATEIKGSPQIGGTVKVKGAPQPDGTIIAREIEDQLAIGGSSGSGSWGSGSGSSGGHWGDNHPDDNSGGHGSGDNHPDDNSGGHGSGDNHPDDNSGGHGSGDDSGGGGDDHHDDDD